MFMQLLAVGFALAVSVLAVAALRGRARVNACCPEQCQDVRLRGV